MTEPYEDEEAIDILGLCKMLHISKDKAYQYGNDPLFPSFRAGRGHRFWPSEVRKWTERPIDDWAQSARSRGRRRMSR